VQIRGYIHFGSTMQKKRYQYAGASMRLLLLCALFLGCSFDESFGLEFNNRLETSTKSQQMKIGFRPHVLFPVLQTLGIRPLCSDLKT
jgi:hypothetical protein